MNTESLARSKIGPFMLRLVSSAMESRFRYRFFSPLTALHGADIQLGQTALEVGCGTGFYTVPAAKLLGDHGSLIALDVLPEAIETVAARVQAANLKNVHLVVGDALNTGLDAGSIDVVLLFGVVPAPMVPLSRLLPEMSRVLKPGGTLSVWPPIPGWLPRSVLRSGLFVYSSERNGVYNFKRR